MTEQPSFCFENDDLTWVINKMEQKQVRRMIVLDQKNKLAGMVSLGDVSVRGDQDLAGEALEQISEPAQPNLVA